MVYLDYNATAPIDSAVREMLRSLLDHCGNPSSLHKHGREGLALLQNARTQVAHFMDVTPGQVTFTSGGTEANNLALYIDNLALEPENQSLNKSSLSHRILMTSAIEHDSILNLDHSQPIIPVTNQGRVKLPELENLLKNYQQDQITLAVMAANNETGVIQDVSAIADLAHRYGADFHLDAVQYCARYPYAKLFNGLRWPKGVTSVAISGHKLGGVMGAGALIWLKSEPIKSLFKGGGQERRSRPGSENLMGIAALGAAVEALGERFQATDFNQLASHRNNMEQYLLQELETTDFRVAGVDAPRVWNTSCLVMPGIEAQIQLMRLDLLGFSVSSGSACSSGKVETSHVLNAMGYEKNHANSAIRVSFGLDVQENDLMNFARSYVDMVKSLQ